MIEEKVSWASRNHVHDGDRIHYPDGMTGTVVSVGGRRAGKQALMDRWLQQHRGTIMVIRPDGVETIEDIPCEVVEPKRLNP